MAEASSSSRALFERFQADFPSSCHSKLRQLLRLARPDDLSLDSPGHVACPICAAEMPLDQVDAHIEAGCPPAETPSSTTKIPMPGPVPGGVTPPAKREKPNPPTEASQTQEESPAAISAPKVKSKSKDKPPAAVSSRGSSRGGSGNLHAFFGGEDTTVPGYFVLHRTAGLPTHATFEREAPPGFQALQHTFTWEGKQARLGEVGAAAAKPTYRWSENKPQYRDAQLLQSHLQKCVRRCRAELAVCSARELLLFDPIKVLRRLPVIMIEDGQLLECLPALVWYMVALSKSYRLSDADTAFLLGVVHAVAASPFKDGAVTWGEVDEKFNGRHIVKAKLSDAKQKNVLFALLLRRAHGGMKGDMGMLTRAAQLWLERFKTDHSAATAMHCTTNPIAFASVPALKPQDWETSAVDFHCSNILELLARDFPGLDQAQLRSAMWAFSSSVSRKSWAPWAPQRVSDGDDAKLKAIWQQVEDRAKAHALHIIRDRCTAP